MQYVEKPSDSMISESSPSIRIIRSEGLRERLVRTRIADIFVLDEEWVLKLYHTRIPFERIVEQYRMDSIVARMAIPAPAIQSDLLQVLDFDERFGIVYQRISGESLASLLRRSPLQLFAQARAMARLHISIHASKASPELPSLKNRLKRKLEEAPLLTALQREQLLDILDQLPDGHTLCHGDFHWENIIVGPAPPIAIDWSDLSMGDALCDVARSWVLCRFNDNCGPWTVRHYCRIFADAYVRSYLRMAGCNRDSVRNWQWVNVAARLREEITSEEKQMLLAYLKTHLPSP